MSNLLFGLLVASGLALALPSNAADNSAMTHGVISKDAYQAQKSRIKAQYRNDVKACNHKSGNTKDICKQEAEGKRDVAMADSEVAYRQTASARYDARIARVESRYKVAKEKCDALSGNAKDVCVKDAKAAEVSGESDAKADKVAAKSQQEAAEKTREARREANEDTREAQYKAASERCDSMAGDSKEECVKAAKAHFGM